jgi:HD-GYP domain-containing protein (c-di-GMP phosphodiesterase class II)
MSTNVKVSHSLKNIFKTPVLLSMFIICFLIAVTIVSYSKFVITPVFSNLLLDNIEKEAARTVDYLSVVIMGIQPYQNKSFQSKTRKNFSEKHGTYLVEELFTKNIREQITEAQFYLQLEKLKFFDSQGKIIYSTDAEDIGKINTKSYFMEKVAKGEKLSKIVSKDFKSSENRIMDTDVAEIYMPLMYRDDFLGALEIYYDISVRKLALDQLVSKTLMVIEILSLVFFLSALLALNRTSIQMLQRKKMDAKLQEVNQTLETRVRSQTKEIQLTQKVSITALAILAEYYDSNTGEHLTRLQTYVEALAQRLKQSSCYQTYLSQRPDYIEELKLACLLHDVGKTAIPIEIITKPGKLTHEEFEVIKTHTTIAGEALTTANEDFKNIFVSDSYLALARDIALYHHEKWNGKGYPKKLSGEAIPLSARIVAVADVYDALRSERPYKKPWSHEKAFQEIVGEKGEHFDPEIIDAFISEAEKFHSISERYNGKEPS